jgi:HEAT repeat protein
MSFYTIRLRTGRASSVKAPSPSTHEARIIVVMSEPTWQGARIPRDAPVIELRALLQWGPPTCWIAFRALGESRDAAAIDLLISEAESPDEFRRRAAVEALGQSSLGGAAVAHVRRLLADPSPFVTRSAIEAAARLRDEQSHSAVLAFLKDRDALTRYEAVRALDALWREDDFENLLATMSKDPDDDTRKEAAWILRRHAPADSRVLIERWRSGPLPRERVWACELIAQSGGPNDRAILEALLRDSDGHVRDAARRALAGLDKRTSAVGTR